MTEQQEGAMTVFLRALVQALEDGSIICRHRLRFQSVSQGMILGGGARGGRRRAVHGRRLP